ncbi:TPA: hypothetical protein DDZ86_01775 [Candidatus Dependentiae bacterium]|nr:MAG: Efflux transporter, RND family, MFP subunit [candidate division TM6 bacterium GW2011_GWF2_43_87]HBL98353.1 hypothetical protein [Candidatus Dependentiae bacterium]
MNMTRIVVRLLFFTLLAGLFYIVYTLFIAKPEQRLYTVQKVSRRSIRHVIKASGAIEAEESMKIGSLVSGILEKMYVEENEFVKKGQLLATIDDGKRDNEVKAAKASLELSQAKLNYQIPHYKRQAALHDAHFISDDEFEQSTRDYETAKSDVALNQAKYDQAVLTFNNKRIIAPVDGIVVGKPSNEGETVTLYAPPTVIYTIARDIRKMEGKIEIDESNISHVKKGMDVSMTFETYLGDVFSSKITDLSNNPIEKGGTVSYNATVPIDNSKLLFKPGMTVDAEIVVAQRENVLAVQAQQFAISPKTIEMIAAMKKLGYKPLSDEDRKVCYKKGLCKTIWIEKEKVFIEKPVKVGVSDGAFFEVLEGLDANDLVVIDTIEENATEKFFKKMFKTGLQ